MKIDIKRIIKLRKKNETAFKLIVIDSSTPDKDYKHLCRQVVLYPDVDPTKQFMEWDYKLQNNQGIPSFEVFEELAEITTVFSNDPLFRDVISYFNKTRKEVLYRGDSVQAWLS